jgi:SAM-dependent methyltransferase
MAPRSCPICERDLIEALAPLYDDRYGYPGEFALYRCNACRHRWLAWQPDEPTRAALYSEYYPRTARSADVVPVPTYGNPVAAWWRGRRSSAAFWVPRDVRVLDIGCGFGEALAYHRRRGCDVEGVETDRNIARVAEQHGFAVRVGAFDPAHYAAASFDYVTMDQVIEHMPDPVASLRGVGRVLAPSGRLVLSTPNAESLNARLFGRRWIHWHAPYHLHFFSVASLARAAALADFAIDTLEVVTNSEWINYQWIHSLTAPAPGEPSTFWAPSRSADPRRTLVRSLRVLHRLGWDHALSRLLDALRIGDNFVAVLRR